MFGLGLAPNVELDMLTSLRNLEIKAIGTYQKIEREPLILKATTVLNKPLLLRFLD